MSGHIHEIPDDELGECMALLTDLATVAKAKMVELRARLSPRHSRLDRAAESAAAIESIATSVAHSLIRPTASSRIVTDL